MTILRQVNRSVAVIKPLQPYVDWCNSMPDIEKTGKYTLECAQEDSLALLVPTRVFMHRYDRWVGKMYKEIFAEMLNCWCTDRGLWPKDVTRKMFREWFKVEIHSEVLDTTSKALIHEIE